MSDEADNNAVPSHGVKIVNRNNLSYRVAQLEKQFAERDKNTCAKIEKLDERVDAQSERTGQYYSVITPSELKKTLEDVHSCVMGLGSMEGRFNEFTTDRVRRLEVANEKIHTVEDEIKGAENRINAKVDANKIKQQQYVIGIIVGLIVTLIAAGVMAFLKF